MKIPAPEIREQLYELLSKDFSTQVHMAMNAKITKARRVKWIMELTKIAYLAGLDRGYDLGFHVFWLEERDQ